MALYRGFDTQEELDAEYDLRRSVPDLAPYREERERLSAQALAELKPHLGVRFGPTVAEHLDVFPAGPGAPVLVFIHGGYWRASSARDYSLVALGPAQRGVTVVVTNYALCPTVTVDEITRQSRAAVAWLWEHAADYGADRERMFVAGHSAGAQQAAMLLATDWETDYGLPTSPLRGGLGLSGIYDLRPIRHTFLQPKLQLTEELAVRQSPLLNLPAAAPPLCVAVGGGEPAEFLRQSRDFAQAWTGSGLEGRYLELEGANHFTAVTGFADPESELCRALFSAMPS